MHVVFVVALSGLLPSPTQMAPNNRELNKYEANKGEVRIGRHVDLCLSSRTLAVSVYGTGAHRGCQPLGAFYIEKDCNAARVISLMRISPVTMSGKLAVKALMTRGPRSSTMKPTSLATVP